MKKLSLEQNDAPAPFNAFDPSQHPTSIPPSKNESDSDKEIAYIKVDDPLGLLRSQHIAAAAISASQSRKRKYKTEAEKLEANRKSAAESRQRKKALLLRLQEEVSSCRHDNSLLLIENAALKKKIAIYEASLQSMSRLNSTNLINAIPNLGVPNPSMLNASLLNQQNPIASNYFHHPQFSLQLPPAMALSSNPLDIMRSIQHNMKKEDREER